MTLTQRLQGDVAAAMRSHDAARRDALRMAVNALQLAAKTARRRLTDDEEIAVLTKEVKTRRESSEAFAAGGRPDLATVEDDAIALISTYLPARLDDAELDVMIASAIDEAGARSPRDLGAVMKLLSPRVRGRADGRVVSQRVTEELGRRAAAANASAAGAGSS